MGRCGRGPEGTVDCEGEEVVIGNCMSAFSSDGLGLLDGVCIMSGVGFAELGCLS